MFHRMQRPQRSGEDAMGAIGSSYAVPDDILNILFKLNDLFGVDGQNRRRLIYSGLFDR